MRRRKRRGGVGALPPAPHRLVLVVLQQHLLKLGVVLLLVAVAGIQVLVLLLELLVGEGRRCFPLVAPLLAPLPLLSPSPAEHGLHARLLVLYVAVVVVWWWAWPGAV